jgi:RNA-binding protein YhbY
MKKLTHGAIIYSLNASDVQTVALQEIERELSEKEIIKIEEVIASNIDWYDAIANAIHSELE